MRRALLALVSCGALMAGPVVALAQTQPGDLSQSPPQSPILTIKQDVLFESSAFGQAVIDRLQEATRDLQAENRAIEQRLEAEERDLTTRRATLPPDQFRTLAEAFDTKVEGIRAAQDAKARDLTRQTENDRQQFYQLAIPILAGIMREFGAVALLDQSAAVLSFESIDITATAVARIDTELGTGTPLPTDAPPTPPTTSP